MKKLAIKLTKIASLLTALAAIIAGFGAFEYMSGGNKATDLIRLLIDIIQ